MSLAYHDAVRWYYSFARFDSRTLREPDQLKLERMSEILAHLDNPHQKFPSILIAGTKGKGSTAALLDSIFRAARYRSGLFTSPHLHSFRERVRVNGELISSQRVVEITAQLQHIAASFPTSTFFEWVTALAFEYFAREKIELAVVEVGLGGRLDCTNVLTPLASVITPISYDHMDILGDTLEQIAFEKAGIVKPNVPVVVAPQEARAMQVIENVAREKNAPLLDVAREWQWQHDGSNLEGQRVSLKTVAQTEWDSFFLPLHGPHQRLNLATALTTLAVLEKQGWKIPPLAIEQGIQSIQWHARFEILARDPYIVADGAHNRASAHELVRTLDEVFPDARVHFIFGASNDKDILGMLQEIVPRATSLIVSQSHHARAAAPDALARIASPFLVPIHTADSCAEALNLGKDRALPGDVICVTGSLFIAAEARAELLQVTGDEGRER